MIFSKKICVILSDDFNLVQLQRQFQFKLIKINLDSYDLIHKLSFEDKFRPSYVQLFSAQISKNKQNYYSLVSPVHIHVDMNGLSLTKILNLSDEIIEPFLARIYQKFNLLIKQLDNRFWALSYEGLNNLNHSIASSPYAIYSHLHQNINNTHNDSFLNEIQMFIRQDPIYQLAKKYTGEYINSIWFWGAREEGAEAGKQNFKFKPTFKKTFGRHLYFDIMKDLFEIENRSVVAAELPNNQFKSNNLLLCYREDLEIVSALLKKYKKNVALYYRKTKLQVR